MLDAAFSVILPHGARVAVRHDLTLPMLRDGLKITLPRLRELPGQPDIRPELRLV